MVRKGYRGIGWEYRGIASNRARYMCCAPLTCACLCVFVCLSAFFVCKLVVRLQACAFFFFFFIWCIIVFYYSLPYYMAFLHKAMTDWCSGSHRIRVRVYIHILRMPIYTDMYVCLSCLCFGRCRKKSRTYVETSSCSTTDCPRGWLGKPGSFLASGSQQRRRS